VEWILDGAADEAHVLVRALRRDIGAYLRRHGAEGSAFGDADVVVAELLTNTVLHARSPSWIAVEWADVRPTLRVVDLGPGFDPVPHLPDATSVGGRGLYLVRTLGDELEIARRRDRGARVTVTLPVQRHPSPSIAPQRRRSNVLPALEEALPSGGFGKESFLRALVVQLARALADAHGPDAAEAAVAQVGTDVGGQMEEEYRRARQIVGTLTHEQIGDCYVRLKHAIDGGFRVVEVSDDRLVLENTQCPFGDAVQRSPSLCRMTSSVFGGIAARNHDGVVTVALEERIAVGDPMCRVTVRFHGGAPAPGSWGHRYAVEPPAT